MDQAGYIQNGNTILTSFGANPCVIIGIHNEKYGIFMLHGCNTRSIEETLKANICCFMDQVSFHISSGSRSTLYNSMVSWAKNQPGIKDINCHDSTSFWLDIYGNFGTDSQYNNLSIPFGKFDEYKIILNEYNPQKYDFVCGVPYEKKFIWDNLAFHAYTISHYTNQPETNNSEINYNKYDEFEFIIDKHYEHHVYDNSISIGREKLILSHNIKQKYETNKRPYKLPKLYNNHKKAKRNFRY
ncbi:hypothetical protein Hokovirus_5_11 [Hokovirus HKV1]|uniref:Uncharacterized protein n=1 Tax=Hokovirus HKV1 TaxID=1977638 RepID=A0A1V0SHD3_9VIRU|nr:hypothetical protein Hokovirus_5_11 [Hokovirus HKV1]